MILDKLATFSGAYNASTLALTGQLLTANTTLGTDSMDLGPLALGGNQVGDLGAGEPLTVEFGILVAPATCTDLTFQIVQADDAALTSNLQVVAQTGAIAIANLPAGTLIPLAYDRAAPLAPKRYIGVRYVATGATITAASVTASIVKSVQDKQTSYKSGFGIS